MPTEIVEFDARHVPDAAELLAHRHEEHRAAMPSLPAHESFEELVGTELDSGSGAAAIDAGRVVGYVLGRHDADEIGPRIWSGLAGHAAKNGELLRDLYGVAAKRWMDEGHRRHFVFVPALPSALDPWFRLSFGASAAMASRPSSAPVNATAAGVLVRRVARDDVPEVARLERMLSLELLESPSFSALVVNPIEQYEREWHELLDDEATYVAFAALAERTIVGEAFLYRRPGGDLRVPPSSIDLANVVVAPSHRRRGVATALAASAISWANDARIETIVTDWRMTNLSASRIWPRLGFEATFLRLYRAIP